MNKYGDKLTDKAYEYAQKYDLKITEGTKGWNDEGDAFRHAYMQAQIAIKSNTGISKTVGDIHEVQGDIQHRQDPKEKNMDLWGITPKVEKSLKKLVRNII